MFSIPSSPTKPQFDAIDIPPPSEPATLLRRRRRHGYHLHSDSDCSDLTDNPLTDEEPSSEPPSYTDLSPICEEDGLRAILIPPKGWLMASLLPRYMDQVSVASTRSTVESALDAFTPYEELRRADESQLDADFEKVLERLKAEWYGVGASVCHPSVLTGNRPLIIRRITLCSSSRLLGTLFLPQSFTSRG